MKHRRTWRMRNVYTASFYSSLSQLVLFDIAVAVAFNVL